MSAETGRSILDGIAIDGDKVTAAAEGVQSDVLKPIGLAFSKNIGNAARLLWMPETTAELHFIAITALFITFAKSERARTDLTNRLKDAPFDESAIKQAMLAVLNDESLHAITFTILSDSLSSSMKVLAQKYIRQIQNLEPVREWILTQLSATTAGAWTAFECLATDTWVAAVNSCPARLAEKALEAKATGDQSDAFSGKSVQVWQLAKYDFDLRNRMGTLLKPKFELTSLQNTRKAYEAIFGKTSVPDDIFKNDDLRLLAASRHVIVHNAGIVDEDFIENTKGLNVGYPLGQPLPLDGVLVSRLANAAIDSGCRLLEFVDNWLVTNPA